MFGMFNSASAWRKGVRVYNLLALGLATLDWWTNPDARKSELGMDMAIHVLNLYCTGENANILVTLLSSGANAFRVGAIYESVVSGTTQVPTMLNIADALLHITTSGTLILTGSDEVEVVQARVAKKA